MKCNRIPETTYGEYAARLHAKTCERRVPVKGILEVTSRCNLNCRHCYVAAGTQHGEDMKTSEILSLIDQLADAGCLWIAFSGGEPLARVDFLEVYCYAKSKGILTWILTNGTLITSEIAACLREFPAYTVALSLYGATASVYEAITGVPGSFDAFKEGLSLLLHYGVPKVKFNGVVTTLNQHELTDMKRFAADLGIHADFYLSLSPRIDGSMSPCEIRLSPEEIVSLDLADEERSIRCRQDLERLQCPEHPASEEFGCSAGIDDFHIDHQGRLNLCTLLRSPGYDLLRGSLAQGWQALSSVRQEAMVRPLVCRTCGWRDNCGHCPAWAMLEHGSPDKPLEYFCQLARLRTRSFQTGEQGRVVEVAGHQYQL